MMRLLPELHFQMKLVGSALKTIELCSEYYMYCFILNRIKQTSVNIDKYEANFMSTRLQWKNIFWSGCTRFWSLLIFYFGNA